MSNKQLHEINFVDANHYNLYMFSQLLQLKVVNPDHFAIEKQECLDRYKVSLGNQLFFMKLDSLNKFWLELAKGTQESFHALKEKVWDDEEIRNRPGIDLSGQTFTADETDDFYSLMGIDFISVENRIRGLMTAVSHAIRDIALLTNKEMKVVELDSTIVKDFDGIMTFRTEVGRDFKVELCFDKVLPVDPNNHAVEIQRTPITPEDFKTYFPNVGDKLKGQLDLVNGLVKSLFESKRIAESEELTKYAEKLINGLLIPPFLDQNITYINFGGRDDWSSMGKETPNNKACFVYLDQETEKLFKLMENIPLEEGVEVWSLDLDTFAIFGRKDNKVVTPALQGYTADILKPYSQGFERVLTNRLGLLDSPHIFKA